MEFKNVYNHACEFERRGREDNDGDQSFVTIDGEEKESPLYGLGFEQQPNGLLSKESE